jgi:uncharacterized Zn-binding protein involved in type VI secretion
MSLKVVKNVITAPVEHKRACATCQQLQHVKSTKMSTQQIDGKKHARLGALAPKTTVVINGDITTNHGFI